MPALSKTPQQNSRMTAMILLAAIVSFAIAWQLVGNGGNLLMGWYFILLMLTLFTLISGCVITGRWTGAWIDDRNVMSLSRFQIILWTLLVLSAFLTAALHNIAISAANPLAITIDKTLWALMGISTASLVGSPLILNDKKDKTPDQTESQKTFELLQRQGDAEGTVDTQGHVVVNNDISQARWSDMFTGEEVGNAAHLDVARLQMFFFTLVTALAYATLLADKFSGNGIISGLPFLDQSMIALIGISHGGYLTSKAVSHSKTGPETKSAGTNVAPNTVPSVNPTGNE